MAMMEAGQAFAVLSKVEEAAAVVAVGVVQEDMGTAAAVAAADQAVAVEAEVQEVVVELACSVDTSGFL